MQAYVLTLPRTSTSPFDTSDDGAEREHAIQPTDFSALLLSRAQNSGASALSSSAKQLSLPH